LAALFRNASLESNKFGQYYENHGMFTGPNGVTLAVRTIWMTEHLSVAMGSGAP